jgi:hypothetical protein
MIGYMKKEKLTAHFEIVEMRSDQSEWWLLYRVDLGRVKELHPEIEWPTWNTSCGGHKVIDYLALSPVYVIRGTREDGKDGVLIFSNPGKRAFYIFAIITDGACSKGIVRNAPTYLPLLFEDTLKYTLFAYVARQRTPHPHATLEARCEMTPIPPAVAALTWVGPALTLSLSHFYLFLS